MFNARVVLDSISEDRIRLVTVEATYPRFIHSELMTHRAFARNAASSRAIPWKRINSYGGQVAENCMMGRIMRNPVIPEFLGVEKKGM